MIRLTWGRVHLLLPLLSLFWFSGEVCGGQVAGQNHQGPSFKVETVPDTVLVGEVFYLRTEVEVQVGISPTFPDTVPWGPYLESARKTRISRTRIAADRVLWIAEYPLVGWKPGLLEIPEIQVGFSRDGSPDTRGGLGQHPVASGHVTVASVLPLEGLPVVPQGPRDPVGTKHKRWALLFGILLIGGGFWGLVPRGGGEEVGLMASTIPEESGNLEEARARAIHQVEELLAGPLPPAIPVARIADRLTEILRSFLLTADPALHEALTTSEVLDTVRRRMPENLVTTLRHILSATDGARYGWGELGEGEAKRLSRGVHHWIRESAEFFRQEAFHG